MLRQTAILIALVLGATSVATAGTPVVNQRQANQEHRIVQGVRSGELTLRETRTLTHQQGRIAAHEAHVKSDGVVTARERVRLDAHQDRASQTIYRTKHNGRERG